jgi:perosamine synthetase
MPEMLEQSVAPLRIPWAKPYFGDEELELVSQVVRSGWMSQGAAVDALEKRVAELTGCQHGVAVSSGTAALDVALKLLQVRPGDEVIVPAFSYIATANAVLYQSATPVFADVELPALTLDPEDVRRKITRRTKGLIGVDYGGQAAQWDALRKLAAEFNIFLVEDAAPAFGGSYRGQALGTLGDIGITSFHTAKIFTSVEGGVVFCDSLEHAAQARVIRSQGESPAEKYTHPVVGHNYRMSDLHAAVGLAQLSRYHQVLAQRAASAAYYSERLAEASHVTIPTVRPENRHAWFLYTVLIPRRDAVRRALLDSGIETNVSWPHPVYWQAPFRSFFRERCPAAEEACDRVLALPLYYELTREEQDDVVEALARATEEMS